MHSTPQQSPNKASLVGWKFPPGSHNDRNSTQNAMYLINSRKDINDGKVFAEKDKLLHVGGLDQWHSVSTAGFLTQLSEKNVLLMVHGFNNPFLYAIRELLLASKRIRYAVQDEYDYIIGYTWPSGLSEFDYFHAKKNTSEAGNRFRNWLQWLTKAGCTTDIMEHSMAALVGYKALRKKADIKIRNLFSLGAAIPMDILKKDENMSPLLEKVQNFYAFHNRNDSILKYGYRLVEWKQALGYAGPFEQQDLLNRYRKINVIDCSGAVQNHTDYLRSPYVIQLIAKLVKDYKEVGRHTRLSNAERMQREGQESKNRYALVSQM